MVEKTQVIEAMQKFSQELNRVHGNSQTAQFVSENLVELQKSEGVAFTGSLQYFLNRVPVVKLLSLMKLKRSCGMKFGHLIT
ncbi:hypothetical protein [Companilactobacillus muriivasis]|uniref:hypothetical protein n=1 Tax=Companilactobacillus muriivasis TaxID=3081444 RepID=UPI0030C73DF8